MHTAALLALWCASGQLSAWASRYQQEGCGDTIIWIPVGKPEWSMEIELWTDANPVPQTSGCLESDKDAVDERGQWAKLTQSGVSKLFVRLRSSEEDLGAPCSHNSCTQDKECQFAVAVGGRGTETCQASKVAVFVDWDYPSEGPTAAPTRSPTAHPLTPRPTTAPSTYPSRPPTATPTLMPTLHACEDGSHGCHDLSQGGICVRSSAAGGWQCECDKHYWCSAGCGGLHGAHTCTRITVAPTYWPTDLPTWRPTGQPSPAPSRFPSWHPTTAPSLTPSSSPSTAPSEAPSVEPSLGPSLPPTTRPTFAPTSPPTEAVPRLTTSTTTTGTAEAGTMGAVLAASAPAAAQGGRIALLAAGCLSATAADSLPRSLHPTGISVPGTVLPHHAGCVLGNLGICIAVVLLQGACAVIAQKVLGVSLLAGQGAVRFPSIGILASVVLCQGAGYAGARLLRHASGAADVAVGLLGVAAAVSTPAAVLWAERCSRKDAIYKMDPRARDGCRRAWLGSGEWLSLERFSVERWGVAFRAALPGESSIIALDIALTQAVSISGGLGGGSCAACGILRLLDVLCGLTICVLAAWRRPYSRPIRLPFTVLAQLLVSAGALVLAVEYFSPGCGQGGGSGAAQPLIAAGGFATVLIVLADGSAMLRAAQLGRRGALQQSVLWFRLMSGGTGQLSRAQLREAVEAMRGDRIPDEVFEGLWVRVDADGSGAVDLHEFLTGEHHFWDAERVDEDPEWLVAALGASRRSEEQAGCRLSKRAPLLPDPSPDAEHRPEPEPEPQPQPAAVCMPAPWRAGTGDAARAWAACYRNQVEDEKERSAQRSVGERTYTAPSSLMGYPSALELLSPTASPLGASMQSSHGRVPPLSPKQRQGSAQLPRTPRRGDTPSARGLRLAGVPRVQESRRPSGAGRGRRPQHGASDQLDLQELALHVNSLIRDSDTPVGASQ
eukprot:TRINITY_DN4509_c0_g1_i1.p1 TRINITY_DN4509_c0_g1~~TRINITY_DN4509_c0_g1_i1.p1  ORF type:complete len:973 (+),score=228.02 TRINITY_DN4509_c0_g1_i1:73-2919(+)